MAKNKTNYTLIFRFKIYVSLVQITAKYWTLSAWKQFLSITNLKIIKNNQPKEEEKKTSV